MPASKHEEQMLNIQRQAMINQSEMQEYMNDLGSWEEEMKAKDKILKKDKMEDDQSFPPVRNSLDKKKKKKKMKVKEVKLNGTAKQKRIRAYDYRSWDKFNVDEELEKIDGEDEKSSSEYETDEEWETERQKHQALLQKDNGNDFFKNGDYDNAIECYSKGINLDPTNAMLPANRAMAFLKQNKFAPAALDCTTALSLDPTYVKAYLRRATAETGLQKYVEAKMDYEKVLKLEPDNKKAQLEIENLNREINRADSAPKKVETIVSGESGIVKPIYKAPEQRSQKPLRRIEIEEIGKDEDETKLKIKEVEAKQSEMKKSVAEKEYISFEKFKSDRTDSEATTASAGVSVSKPLITEVGEVKLSAKTEDKSTAGNMPIKRKSKPSEVSESHSQKEIMRNTTTKSSDVLNLSVPKTSIQFHADYKSVRNNGSSFYNYMKNIEPSNYTKLFGEYLESDLLMDVLRVYCDYFVKDRVDIYDHLKCLTRVKRFSMVTMFFSEREKAVVREIFDYMRKNSASERDIDNLAKLYGL